MARTWQEHGKNIYSPTTTIVITAMAVNGGTIIALK